MNYVSFEEENIQSFKINQTALSNSKLAGSCELGTAEIQLLNDSNEYSDFKGNWIKTIKGSFYIYDVEPVQEKINIKLSCYDIKYLLDVTYDETDYKDMFPCTLVEWRDKMAEDLGITFGDDGDFANANYTLSEHPYVDDSVSYRDVFKMQAEAGASWIETDENDVFYFAWVKSSANIVFDDWFSLTTEKTATSPVNEVVLGRGDVEDIVIWPNPAPDDVVEFRIDNNYILDPQDTTEDTDRREEVIEEIYNRVVGMSYIPFELNTEGIDNVFDIELGSKVTYTDVWSNELESFVMSIEWEFLGGDLSVSSNWGITIKAEEISSTSTEYSYAGSTSNTLTKISLSVDKSNKTIEALVQEQTETSSQLANLSITTNDIQSQVSTTNEVVANLGSQLTETQDTLSSDYNELLSKFDDYATTGEVNEIVEQVTTQITDSYSKTEIQKILNGTFEDENGEVVTSLVRTTTGQLDEDGLSIQRTNANTDIVLGYKEDSDENELEGLIIYDTGSSSKELLFAGYDSSINQTIVRANNINITTYATIGSHSRLEDYEDGTGVFYL